jgi:drug/metabolite transporter (DMT)-like permease
VRFFIGGALLLAVAFWRGLSLLDLAGQWRHILVMSLLGVAICNGLHTWGMQWVPSHTSALLNASSALWIVVFGLFGVRAHRPGARAISGLAIGFVGTALLILPAAATSADTATPLTLNCHPAGLRGLVAGHHLHAQRPVKLDLFAMVGSQMLVVNFPFTVGRRGIGEWTGPGRTDPPATYRFQFVLLILMVGWPCMPPAVVERTAT